MITSYEAGHTSYFLQSAEFVLALRGFNRYGFRVSEKSVRNSLLDHFWRRPRDLVKCSLNKSTSPSELSENCQFLKRARLNAWQKTRERFADRHCLPPAKSLANVARIKRPERSQSEIAFNGTTPIRRWMPTVSENNSE